VYKPAEDSRFLGYQVVSTGTFTSWCSTFSENFNKGIAFRKYLSDINRKVIITKIINGLNVHGPVHRKKILIYIQQDATLHSLFYLETALHVSGGTTTHHQERKQLYLQHLVFVTPLLLSAAIVEELELV